MIRIYRTTATQHVRVIEVIGKTCVAVRLSKLKILNYTRGDQNGGGGRNLARRIKIKVYYSVDARRMMKVHL